MPKGAKSYGFKGKGGGMPRGASKKKGKRTSMKKKGGGY